MVRPAILEGLLGLRSTTYDLGDCRCVSPRPSRQKLRRSQLALKSPLQPYMNVQVALPSGNDRQNEVRRPGGVVEYLLAGHPYLRVHARMVSRVQVPIESREVAAGHL